MELDAHRASSTFLLLLLSSCLRLLARSGTRDISYPFPFVVRPCSTSRFCLLCPSTYAHLLSCDFMTFDYLS